MIGTSSARDGFQRGNRSSGGAGCAVTAILLLALAMSLPIHPRVALAQDAKAPVATSTPAGSDDPTTVIAGSRAQLPLADPVLAKDAKLFGQRASVWTVSGTQFALLDGDVSFAVGGYGFRGDRASVRIDTETVGGKRVRHLAVYLMNARTLAGAGAITAEGGKLFVTVSITGQIDLSTDAWRDESAAADPLVTEAHARLLRHLASISLSTQPVPTTAKTHTPIVGPDGVSSTAASDSTRGAGGIPSQRIFDANGTIAFSADKFVFEKGKPDEKGKVTESAVSLMGRVRVVYQDAKEESTMTLRAENAVIFLAGDNIASIGGNRTKAGDVRGIYLEDNVVVTHGDYTVRAPRIYYDVAQNKALLLEAVLFAWDVKRQIPLYMRGEKLKQESARNWTAEGVQLTTSEFAEPHVAIGADRVTFRQEQRRDGTVANKFTADNSTIRVWGAPVFYTPGMAGEANEIPLRRLDVGYSSKSGPEIRSRWDVFSLLSREAPEGVDLTAQADWRGEHGPGLGLNLDYNRPEMLGFLDSYLVIGDNGEDELSDTRSVAQDGDTRGFIHALHRGYLSNDWEMTLELSYVSDPTFLEEYFRSEAETSKNYETAIYLKKQTDTTAFTFLAQAEINDFTPQLTTLQAPGYTVERHPELQWRQIGESLFGNRVTYFGESRASYMRIRAGDDSPADRGFNNFASAFVFGIPLATTEFEDALTATGVPNEHRLRVDTRHELMAPLKLSIFNITPYVSGRLTGYDDDFVEFAGENDQYRAFGTVGARIQTHFSKVYEDVNDRVFDLRRLRHIVEPAVDLSYAGSTVNPEDIPVYDNDVEALNEGYTVRLGLRNTFQTQRGGEGRWRDVDWLTIDTDLIFRGDDASITAPIARYFSYRPEYSPGGDHFYSRVMWAVSEALAAAGEVTWDFETEQLAQWRAGVTYQASPVLTWFADYSRVDAIPSSLFSWGFTYELTVKYQLAFRHIVDLEENQMRGIEAVLVRKLPRWQLAVFFAVDDIDDDKTIGIVLIPDGVKTSRLDRPFSGWLY